MLSACTPPPPTHPTPTHHIAVAAEAASRMNSALRVEPPSTNLHLQILTFSAVCPPNCSSKSTVAAEAASRINSALRVEPLQNRVSPETEDVFNDAFWDRLDLVVNALDNVNARYSVIMLSTVNEICVFMSCIFKINEYQYF